MSAVQLPNEVITPEMKDGGNLSVTTDVNGTLFTKYADQPCKQLTIANNSGTTVEVQQDAAGVALPIFDQTYYTIYGLGNANQIGVRRVDQAGTGVIVRARWEK